MKRLLYTGLAACIMIAAASVAIADSILLSTASGNASVFPDLSEKKTEQSVQPVEESTDNIDLETALWPFGKKDNSGDDSDELKPKSTRKAFFLSFLVPGLGEAYVGSKSWIAFIGVELVSWYIYTSYTGEGNDLENDFQDFANAHWNYDTLTASDGSELDHNYWEWVRAHFREVGLPDDLQSTEFTAINEQLEKVVNRTGSSILGHSVHQLPSTKTQQYYEMIGKYPQFVYGWEDVGKDEVNPTVREDDGTVNYYVNINNVKSPLRMEYEDMRDDSNQKLKMGQRGIHIMILNRVVSGIHAARLAYKQNRKIDSELSSIRIDFAEKYIIDNKVPMIRLTKTF